MSEIQNQTAPANRARPTRHPIRRQLRSLYLISGVGSFQIAGAAWVALLAARGFTLGQIGLMEAGFHLVSLCFEIPSGAIADVVGRKKAMIIAQLMSIAASLLMILSRSFATAALAVGLSALSYNFASGTREALAYDSLKAAGIEAAYDRFAVTEQMLYRISTAAATLCAGLTLLMGYRLAYAVDMAVRCAALAFACRLHEAPHAKAPHAKAPADQAPHAEAPAKIGLFRRIAACMRESLAFLTANRRLCAIMVLNAGIGATATLMLFFLQARLPADGLPDILLGPALFVMGLGSLLGARMTGVCRQVPYRRILIISGIGTAAAAAAFFLHSPFILCLGGLIAAGSDDFLQIRTDVLMNQHIPSAQRATLISVSSFIFSAVMIILSPAAGWLLQT